MKITNRPAAEKMLGFIPEQVDLMIATPLSFLFKEIYIRFEERKQYKGFYESYIITGPSGKIILLIKTAQGIQCQDIFYLFKDIDILFLGYAGGLSDKVYIGNIYPVDQACFLDEEIFLSNLCINNRKSFSDYTPMRKWIFSEEYPSESLIHCCNGIRGGYSPAMIGRPADEYCRMAKNLKCDIVDMEIFFGARTCKENNNSFEAWVLITDLPGKCNFWELTELEGITVSEGNDLMISKVSEYMRKVILNER